MFAVRLASGFLVALDERTLSEWHAAESLCLFDAMTLSGCPSEEAADAATGGVVVAIEQVEIDAPRIVLS